MKELKSSRTQVFEEVGEFETTQVFEEFREFETQVFQEFGQFLNWFERSPVFKEMVKRKRGQSDVVDMNQSMD